jgi:hypothetical protein
MEAELDGHFGSKTKLDPVKPTAFVSEVSPGRFPAALDQPALSIETGMSRCLEAEIGQNSEFVDRPVGLALASTSSFHLWRALPR